MNTPKTDEIIKYCEYQFPATQGHIPLRKMIEEIEIEKNNVLRDFDEVSQKIDPLMNKATKIYHENESLKKLLAEIQDWMRENDYECGDVGAALYEEIEKHSSK